jgi:hypothetical protein
MNYLLMKEMEDTQMIEETKDEATLEGEIGEEDQKTLELLDAILDDAAAKEDPTESPGEESSIEPPKGVSKELVVAAYENLLEMREVLQRASNLKVVRAASKLGEAIVWLEDALGRREKKDTNTKM